jgi:hypothetical protein
MDAATGPSVGTDDLWDALESVGDPLAPAVDEAVELAREGDPVAVVGRPFGGRERVLERVADRLGARQEALTPGDGPPSLGDATVAAGTHHLYNRSVGGFEPLDALLDRLTRTDSPLVTGWNWYAWSYLTHARDVEAAFEAVAVPGIDREAVGALVQGWSPTVTFRAPPAEERGLLGVDRRTLSLPLVGAREVPVPTVDPGVLGRDAEEDPEAAVIQRLTAVSNGNPGVAQALWFDCIEADAGSTTVDPTDLRTPVERRSERATERDRAQRERGTAGAGTPTGTNVAGTDRRTGFCCRLVLAGERLPRRVIRDSVRDADRLLGRLERRGYLTLDDGEARLRPAAVPDAIDLTEGRRIP